MENMIEDNNSHQEGSMMLLTINPFLGRLDLTQNES